jgi:hypothetical protein
MNPYILLLACLISETTERISDEFDFHSTKPLIYMKPESNISQKTAHGEKLPMTSNMDSAVTLA